MRQPLGVLCSEDCRLSLKLRLTPSRDGSEFESEFVEKINPSRMGGEVPIVRELGTWLLS